MDFSDKELDTLEHLVNRLRVHRTIGSDTTKFNVHDAANRYQSLESSGYVYTSHKGDRTKLKYYWWYLTPKGLRLIEEMIAMKDL